VYKEETNVDAYEQVRSLPFSAVVGALVLAIIEKRRNWDASPAGASSGRIVFGAEARRMG
jgi:hypothetical protein